MLAYHVTLRENLTPILQHGLTPRTGSNASKLGERTDAVYCFTSMEACEDALTNWLGETFEEDAELLILTVKLDGLKVRALEVEWELAVEETIPPQRILAAVNESGAQVSLPRIRA
jgi:hypothetical protein